jgi:hypothetical protein
VARAEAWNTVSKITKEKVARSMSQIVKHLPSKYEALSSNPNNAKNKKKRESEIDYLDGHIVIT